MSAKELSTEIADIESCIADAAVGIAVYGKADPRKGLAIMRLMDFHVGRLLQKYADAKSMTVDEFIEWKQEH